VWLAEVVEDRRLEARCVEDRGFAVVTDIEGVEAEGFARVRVRKLKYHPGDKKYRTMDARYRNGEWKDQDSSSDDNYDDGDGGGGGDDGDDAVTDAGSVELGEVRDGENVPAVLASPKRRSKRPPVKRRGANEATMPPPQPPERVSIYFGEDVDAQEKSDESSVADSPPPVSPREKLEVAANGGEASDGDGGDAAEAGGVAAEFAAGYGKDDDGVDSVCESDEEVSVAWSPGETVEDV